MTDYDADVDDDAPPPPQPPPKIQSIAFSDVTAALAEGWRDYRAAPAFGLFFSAVYVLGGIIIYLQLSVLEQSWWILPIAVGFPLVGPFAAVGLYEVSRRIETGERLEWAEVLGVVFRQKDRQIPSLAVVVIMIFLFWIYAAHLVFALFFGLKTMTNVMTSFDILLTTDGLIMLAVGTVVGAGLSFILFAITVVGLPLLLDREIDFVSAMIASFQAVTNNLGPMLGWGAIVVIFLALGMAPLFLGLFVTLPVLGHATWRLYRRCVTF